jgi:hypothetical protein
MKKLAIASILIVTLVVSVLAVFSAGLWYPGITPTQTAKIIVHDSKFGMRGTGAAIFYGDPFIHALKSESQDYELVNGRNAFWIVEILSAKETDVSHAAAVELYGNQNLKTKLAGAAVLAKYGDLSKHEFLPGGLIHDILAKNQYGEKTGSSIKDSDYIELALQATVNANSKDMVPYIISILNSRPSPYWSHAKACDALAQLNATEAIPALIEAMKSEEFYALPNAFNALAKLGEKDAVPLAISRIGPDIEGKNSGFVIDELEKFTGKSFGKDKAAWERWWHEESNKRVN